MGTTYNPQSAMMEAADKNPTPLAPRGAGILYGLTIFVGAFLLFQVEPIIAKIILPWFGGASAVWTTCLLFFQVVLLLGYLYAHWIINRFRPKIQGRLHLGLLALGIILLPIMPGDAWKPLTSESPSLHILLLLGATVGVPYFLLSATSPLLQAWYAQGHRARNRTGFLRSPTPAQCWGCSPIPLGSSLSFPRATRRWHGRWPSPDLPCYARRSPFAREERPNRAIPRRQRPGLPRRSRCYHRRALARWNAGSCGA